MTARARLKRVIVMQGASGAGKTTAARGIAGRAKSLGLRVCIVSHDDYFKGRAFEPRLMGDASAACMARFARALYEDTNIIVVDNTATRANEIDPYAQAARAHGYELRVIRIECDPATAYARNVHDVPLRTVRAQAARIAALPVRPEWRLIRLLPQPTQQPAPVAEKETAP